MKTRFVKQLKADGVEGIQSYNFITQNGKAEDAEVKQAVQKAGADGVLITRLVRVDVNVQVVQPMGFYGGYGGYAGAWGGYYDPPMATTTDTLVLETTLWGLNDSTLLWSGTTETFAPTNIQQEIEQFCQGHHRCVEEAEADLDFRGSLFSGESICKRSRERNRREQRNLDGHFGRVRQIAADLSGDPPLAP